MAAPEHPVRPTLIFIPDISGFTNFVNATEISHSQHIISELLQELVEANSIGLRVSSFEGDAVLFYRDGPAPTAVELLTQIQQMYIRFHAHLRMYEAYRICHCGACTAAANLSVKFVAHYGDVSHNVVLDRETLHGAPVIAAHRLLKNDLDHNEYGLLTKDLISNFGGWVEAQHAAWCEPIDGSGDYDIGTLNYCWIDLSSLRDRVPAPEPEDFGLGGPRTHFLSAHTMLDVPLELAFNIASDLGILHEWLDGIKGGEEINGRLTRAGTAHRCIIKGDDSDPVLVAHSFETSSNVVAFTNTSASNGIDTVNVLTADGDRTRYDVKMYVRKGFPRDLLAKLVFGPLYRRSLKRSFAKLNELCLEYAARGEEAPLQILLEPWTGTVEA